MSKEVADYNSHRVLLCAYKILSGLAAPNFVGSKT